MRLQLLIARHSEPLWMVRRMLSSIANQVGVDFSQIGVIICEDGPDEPIPDSELAMPFEVWHMVREHGGVSRTRNAMLDEAIADYVMMCDMDDMFHDMLGLRVMLSYLETGCDALVSAFVQEDGFVMRERDPYFNHGKAFRRMYLVENGIRWLDELETSGDCYFLWQALLLTDRVAYCDSSFYIWRTNPASICRGEPDHFIRSYALAVTSEGELVGNFLSRGRDDLARTFVARMVVDAYLMMTTERWAELSGEQFCLDATDTLRLYYDRHKRLFESVTPQELSVVWRDKLKSRGTDGPQPGLAGLDEWLDVVRGMACAR